MFDDLMNGTDRYRTYDSDYRHKCPYCGSYNIEKGVINCGIDDTWYQKCHCNSCDRFWKFNYIKNFLKLYAELEKPNLYEVF